MNSRSHLVVLSPPDLESGFLLAGVEVRVVADRAEAETSLDRLMSEGTAGVIAVYEPFLSGMSADRRSKLERSLVPVVVPLPSGLAADGGGDHRARLLSRLQRAIGFRVTFGEEHDA